jgi:hypothetical protein
MERRTSVCVLRPGQALADGHIVTRVPYHEFVRQLRERVLAMKRTDDEWCRLHEPDADRRLSFALGFLDLQPIQEADSRRRVDEFPPWLWGKATAAWRAKRPWITEYAHGETYVRNAIRLFLEPVMVLRAFNGSSIIPDISSRMAFMTLMVENAPGGLIEFIGEHNFFLLETYLLAYRLRQLCATLLADVYQLIVQLQPGVNYLWSEPWIYQRYTYAFERRPNSPLDLQALVLAVATHASTHPYVRHTLSDYAKCAQVVQWMALPGMDEQAFVNGIIFAVTHNMHAPADAATDDTFDIDDAAAKLCNLST